MVDYVMSCGLGFVSSLWSLDVILDLKCEWDRVSSPSMRDGTFSSIWSGGLMPSSIGMFLCGCGSFISSTMDGSCSRLL